MRIGILGGSFDPPHFGHLLVARQILELTGIDHLWIMPVYNTTSHHKVFQKKLSSTEDRLAMAKLLEDDKIKVSDFEINNNKKSLTITTLKSLTNKYHEHTFYWIVGSDRLEAFHLWDDWQEIINNYHLIIFPREQNENQLEEKVKQTLRLQRIPENVIVLQNNKLIIANISSTAIRERVKKDLQIDFLVPEKVEIYIRENKLYQ